MSALTMPILEACAEATRRRQEMLPLLAAAQGVSPGQVFYAWMSRRGNDGPSPDPAWEIRFHGFECDLHNVEDGRHLRYDFGPKGSVDTMTGFGVLQFIVSSRPPWRTFPELCEQLDLRRSSSGWITWGDGRFYEEWDLLVEEGLLAPADPELVDLQRRCTTVGADGITTVGLPEGLPEEIFFDALVANREVLAPRALVLLEEARPHPRGET
jgi:hypothetical protein